MTRRPRRSTTTKQVAGSSAPSGPRPIGLRLRTLREAAGISQSALAERAGIRQGRLSELELGTRVPTAELTTRYLDALGVTADVREDILDQLVEHRAQMALWRRLHRVGLHQHQRRYGAMERSATVVREWSDHLVPGLLQTAGYTRAMCQALRTPAITDVEGIVRGRAERQEILLERTRRFSFLVAEDALRTRDIPAEVMDEQLDSILLTAAASHVDIGVVPSGVMIPATTFLIVDERVVLVELETREVTIHEPDEVARYAEVFEQLRTRAVEGEGLADLVRNIRRGLTGLSEQPGR